MTSQKGSAHVIIIVGLVTLLIGALGFIFWQNFIATDSPPAKVSEATRGEDTVEEAAPLPEMVTYEPEVSIINAEDVSALKNAPESFKEFIITSIGKEDKTSDSEPKDDCYSIFTVNKIYKQKYATGGVSAGGDCVGGAAVLWGIIDGNWKDISGTQNIGFACEDLELYKVPSAIAGTTCYDPSSPSGSRPYNQS